MPKKKILDTKPVVSEEAKKTNEAMDFVSRAKKLFRYAADARRKYDYEWMVRDLFRRGYQFSQYSPTSQTVVLSQRQEARIPINITAAYMRSICNQVTSFQPKWECLPTHGTEESKVQARYSQLFLDNIYETENIKTKIKETVKQGLMFSVGGPWQIVYNKRKNKVEIWLIDTFDFYWDPFADEISDAEFVIKAVRRPMDEVKKNPDFNQMARDEIHGTDGKAAASEYKQFMIQAMRQVSPSFSDTDYSAVILYEGYFRVRADDGSIKQRKLVWTDQNLTPLIDETLEDEEHDFVLYRADLNPKEILGESWMKNVLPLNRAINQLESSVYEYANRVAKGRIVVDKDSGVRAIHNVHGEIISKNRGSEVKALEMPAMPNSVNLLINRLYAYMENIGGVHDATLGRMPTGVRSGIGVAELRQADSTNQADLVDNLEDFLAEVGRKVLNKIAKYYNTYHVVHIMGQRETTQKAFAVVGEASGRTGNKSLSTPDRRKVKIGPDVLDLAIIGEDNNIRVTIGSWLGYTKEAMQEKVLKFAEIGLIDTQTALSLLEFGNVDEIIQRVRKESLFKRVIERAQQNPDQQDDYALAYEENDMMALEGKDMPVQPQDDHLVHITIHQEALGQGDDENVLKHIELHQTYLNSGESANVSAQTQDIMGPQATAPSMPAAGQPPMQQGQPQMQPGMPPTMPAPSANGPMQPGMNPQGLYVRG